MAGWGCVIGGLKRWLRGVTGHLLCIATDGRLRAYSVEVCKCMYTAYCCGWAGTWLGRADYVWQWTYEVRGLMQCVLGEGWRGRSRDGGVSSARGCIIVAGVLPLQGSKQARPAALIAVTVRQRRCHPTHRRPPAFVLHVHTHIHHLHHRSHRHRHCHHRPPAHPPPPVPFPHQHPAPSLLSAAQSPAHTVPDGVLALQRLCAQTQTPRLSPIARVGDLG